MTTEAPRPELASIQDKYAKRIKARLAQPRIDVAAARDGMLDCFVATYFGGLKAGIGGFFGIDATEEQVSRVAEALFRRRLKEQGASFEAPTTAALDRVKLEVDRELHFEELPAELRGLHDQVCSLMLAKADGSLEHRGPRTSVARPEVSPAAPTEQATAPTPPSAPALAPASVTSIPAPSRLGSLPPEANVDDGLRAALVAYLVQSAEAVRTGEDVSALRARVSRIERLVTTLADFA
ncbi:MAG: hypothetical protein H6721_04845 [Sandaracinus sp.]|nr:hypothetical protein [Sandaracinus sp.]MCB9631455.1 hypothetical protein [Sandaracinus sp.]